MPFSLLMTITRSTASAPICVPQLPPVIFMNAGALQPSAVRHVATPLPCSAPKMNPPFYQVGYDRYALCLLQNFVGNALVRRVHDLVQHFGRIIQPVTAFRRADPAQHRLAKLSMAASNTSFFIIAASLSLGLRRLSCLGVVIVDFRAAECRVRIEPLSTLPSKDLGVCPITLTLRCDSGRRHSCLGVTPRQIPPRAGQRGLGA
jgi:hypothetical protein